tara:strand:- start:1059 stop:1271 length:213 start_codon:yes stop_codon:yes gene_type:complete
MKILNNIKHVKRPLPNEHKLNVRYRQMRGCYQVFSGRTYLSGASGETIDEAINQLKSLYIFPYHQEIAIH